MDAHKAVRALEKLRQRALDEFTDHERRTEQKEIDLLGVMQYAMRSSDADRRGDISEFISHQRRHGHADAGRRSRRRTTATVSDRTRS